MFASPGILHQLLLPVLPATAKCKIVTGRCKIMQNSGRAGKSHRSQPRKISKVLLECVSFRSYNILGLASATVCTNTKLSFMRTPYTDFRCVMMVRHRAILLSIKSCSLVSGPRLASYIFFVLSFFLISGQQKHGGNFLRGSGLGRGGRGICLGWADWVLGSQSSEWPPITTYDDDK